MGVCGSRPGSQTRFDTPNSTTAGIPLLSSLTNADSAHVNELLNSLHNNEVETLIQIFTYHCRQYYAVDSTRPYNAILHNVKSLKVIFPALQDEIFSDKYISNIFMAFDNTNKSYIDLRDFCRVYVIAMRGSKYEMIELLFSIFADLSCKSPETDRLTISDASLVGKKSSNIRQTHPTDPEKRHEDMNLAARSLSESRIESSMSFESFSQLIKLFNDKNNRVSRIRETAMPLCPMNLSDFTDFAVRYIDESSIRQALSIFDLLPKVAEERSITMSAASNGLYALAPGQLVYAISERWWNQWCHHIGVVADLSSVVFDSSFHGENGTAPSIYLIQSIKASSPSCNASAVSSSHMKPDEIDNSNLQDSHDLNAFSSQAIGANTTERFVFISGPLWFALAGIYGGGPDFPRRIRSIVDASTLNNGQSQISDIVDEKVDYSEDIQIRIDEKTLPKVFDIDLRPLVLQGYWCAASGHPCSFRQKALLSRGGDAKELIRWALVDIGINDLGSSSRNEPSMDIDDINLWILREATRLNCAGSKSNRRSNGAVSIDRMTSTPGPTFSDIKTVKSTSIDSDSQNKLSDASQQGYDDTAEDSTSVNKEVLPSKWLRHGPETYWQLIEGDLRNEPLENLGIASGFIVMLESRCTNNEKSSYNSPSNEKTAAKIIPPSLFWPTDRVLEEPNFRDFRMWKMVDVMNFRGKWCVAQIVKVFKTEDTHVKASSSGSHGERSISKIMSSNERDLSSTANPIFRNTSFVRVRFYRMSPKHDEDIETHSHRIAPLGSWTFLSVNEEGSNSSLCTLPELLVTEVLTRRCDFYNALGDLDASVLHGSNESETVVKVRGNSKPNSISPMVRSESHLVVRRRTSFVHYQSSVVRRLQSSLNAAKQSCERASSTEMSTSDSVATSLKNTDTTSSLSSSLSIPFHAIKTFVINSTKSNETSKLEKELSRQVHGNLVTGSSTHITEPVSGDGCVGLANLGNTCYMCAALQCLSHTPLLRHFFLSGRFQSEISRTNPLGTGGIIAQEFYNLMKLLWGSKGHVVPSKFKKCLGKCKPQFSGNDQNDAQEFLAELLDMLHEDLNRVIVKEYIELPSDEELKRLSFVQQAEGAWSRHIARNRSVLVDLFQGQLCSKITCPCCAKVSRTFDPFMFLSVPLLAKQHESNVYVTVVRRMKVHRIRNSSVIDSATLWDSYSKHRNLSRYNVTLPRLGDVNDLKLAINKLTGVPVPHMRAVIAKGRRILRNLQDCDSLIDIAEFGGNRCIIYESCKDIPFLSTVSISRFNNRRAALSHDPVASENIGSDDYFDKSDYDRGHTSWEGDVIVDIGSYKDENKTAYWENGDIESEREEKKLFWPDLLSGFHEGMRVDAMDMRGQWFSGCIEEIRVFSPQQQQLQQQQSTHKIVPKPCSPKLMKNGASTSNKKSKEYYARIHFDNFSSLWDEWISEEDFQNNRIERVYSHTERKIKLLELQVVNRKKVDTNNPRAGPHSMELFGLPFVLHCESVRSCRYVVRLITEQSIRFMTQEEVQSYIDAESMRSNGDRDEDINNSSLPFTIRMISTHRPLVTGQEPNVLRKSGEISPNKKSHHHEASVQQEWEGSLFPSSKEIPLCNIFHQKLLIAVDWNDISETCRSIDPKLGRDLPYSDHEDYVSAVMELNNFENAVREDGSITQMHRAPDAFASFLKFALNENIDLHDCLKAFTNAEVLDEDTWYCSTCKTHRKGLMQTSIYRLPDILVIHIKRFSMTARRKDKIRTKVEFPLVSLNMSAYLSPEGNDTTGGSIYDLYAVSNHIGDMSRGHYTAFVNCQVETSLEQKDTSSFQGIVDTGQSFDTASPGKGRWYLFDDEMVEEVPPSKIVSPSAYVLFYKRRKLTPSNIINLTA